MQAQITIHNYRFFFSYEYDYDIVKWFKKIDRSIFHRDTKEWSFPIENKDKFLADFAEKFPDIDLQVGRRKSTLKHEGDCLQLVLGCFVDNWRSFRVIKGYAYDRETKILSFPFSEIERVKEALAKNDIDYKYDEQTQ